MTNYSEGDAWRLEEDDTLRPAYEGERIDAPVVILVDRTTASAAENLLLRCDGENHLAQISPFDAPATPFGYHSIMIRLLLTCIGVAALQLGTPRAVGAIELSGPTGHTQSVTPRVQAQATRALTRHGSWTDAVQVAHVTPGAPAGRPHLPCASGHDSSPTLAPRRSGPTSHPRVLPDARAPPA